MSLNNNDTFGRLIPVHFRLCCSEPFSAGGSQYEPAPLVVSPGIFRGFTCPPVCGGCCFRVSLDWLPFEERPESEWIKERNIEVNGKSYPVYTDLQSDHEARYCRNLDRNDGRCGVHGKHPFSCDFELIRFLQSHTPNTPNRLNQKLFGRGWNLRRVDGQVGARCEMTPVDSFTHSEVVRKLKRLKAWMDYFEIPSKLPAIITWAELGPHETPLTV